MPTTLPSSLEIPPRRNLILRSKARGSKLSGFTSRIPFQMLHDPSPGTTATAAVCGGALRRLLTLALIDRQITLVQLQNDQVASG